MIAIFCEDDTIFGKVDTIFGGKKLAFFLKNQCYDQNFT
jgi:hypothetical protein